MAIEGGRFLATFGPYPTRPEGPHEVTLEFDLWKQPPLRGARWSRTLGPREKAAYEEVRVRALWPAPAGAQGVGGVLRVAGLECVRGVADRLEAEVAACADCPGPVEATLTFSRDGQPLLSRRLTVNVDRTTRVGLDWPGRLPPGEWEVTLGSEAGQRRAWRRVR